jgi:hypothetical protein
MTQFFTAETRRLRDSQIESRFGCAVSSALSGLGSHWSHEGQIPERAKIAESAEKASFLRTLRPGVSAVIHGLELL